MTHDQDKSRSELVEELARLRRRVATLEELRGPAEHSVADALQEREQQYRRIFDSVTDCLILCDFEGFIVEANPAACQTYGYTREEMIGHRAVEFVHPDYRHLFGQFRDQIAVGRHFCIESVDVRKDGTPLNVEVRGSTLSYGGKPHVLAVMRDVSECTRAAEALRQSHEELQAIHDGIGDGLAVADVEDTRLIRVNRKFCEMLGYSEEELLFKPVAELHPASEWPRVQQLFEKMALGETPMAANCPVLRKDGSIFYADIPVSLVTYNQRQCAIGFFRDVTERRQAEEAFQNEHRALRQLLKSHDHERKLIAYEIHDGIAQLLAGIMMQFQTHQQLQEENPEGAALACVAAQDMLARCLAETRRLINEVRMPLLDESGVVAAIENLVYESNGHGGPQIEFHVQVDFERLEPVLEHAIFRIVQEGLTNARRYSESERICVGLTQQNGRVCIAVEDWGVGFTLQEVSDRSFGLEGIKERARLLGGQVTIDTEPGRGTRILADLPLVAVD